MRQTKKHRRRRRHRTRRRTRRGGAPPPKKSGAKPKTGKKTLKKKPRSKAGIRLQKALINFLLILPQKTINIILSIYLKFSNIFFKKVEDELKKLPNQDTASAATKNKNLIKATLKVIESPKFKKIWTETIEKIFNVVLTPLFLAIINIVQQQGFAVADSVAKIVRRLTLRSAQGGVEALTSAAAAVPGVGTVLGILTVVQQVFDSVSVLTIQSLSLVTSVMGGLMSIVGKVIPAVREGEAEIKKLKHVVSSIEGASATGINKASKAISAAGNRGPGGKKGKK